MSLINDALKKAQRLRSAPAAASEASTAGPGAPIRKRAAPLRAQTTILLAAAAAALVVCSVVVTVYFLNRGTAAPLRRVTTPLPTRPVVAQTESAAPVIAAPVITAPAPVREPAAADNPAELVVARTESARAVSAVAGPAPAAPAAASAPDDASAGPVARATPVPIEAPATPVRRPAREANAAPDPRILNYIDGLKVAGIRSSGNESKVLMNDRVYRVNDMVERALGVKLVKVQSDSLTFTDPNGVVYTKTF